MMEILPTVSLFSNRNLATGEEGLRGYFMYSQRFNQTQEGIEFGEGMSFETHSGLLKVANQEIRVKNFYTVSSTKEGKGVTQTQTLHLDGDLSVIYLKDFGGFIVADESMINSNYIQMFVFENYDHTLFEKLPLSNGLIKVYKLK
jgi:hypothetical protein